MPQNSDPPAGHRSTSQQELAALVRTARCRVFGAGDASNDAHRAVLAALIAPCTDAHTTVLCEPSLAGKTTRPPDVVFVDLLAGIHVIEVKAVTLEQIEAIEPGGQFRVRYGQVGYESKKNPFSQVRNALFDIKDAIHRNYPAEFVIPLRYWVVLPNVTREDWKHRWERDGFCPPELLFGDDLETLADRLRSLGQKELCNKELRCWPTDQVQATWKAFGDSAVLFPRPVERQPRKLREGTLGEYLDDAQNLYGRPRPNWRRLGLNVVGRSHVMIQCFRNTKQIVEVASNVLYGSFAKSKASVPTRAFGDIATLEEKGLLEYRDGAWKVRYAHRNGRDPMVTLLPNRQRQTDAIVRWLSSLIEDQQVRPEDILILVYYRHQLDGLTQAIASARIPAVQGIHLSTSNKDASLHRRGHLIVSTVASSKGDDAYCVLIGGGESFLSDKQGRARFYVACTRAIEYLEVFASTRSELMTEMERAIETQCEVS